MKNKCREFFVNFLIRFGKESSESFRDNVDLLVDFDKFWDDKYLTNPEALFNYCNKLLYINASENNKKIERCGGQVIIPTDVLKFRIYTMLGWIAKSGFDISKIMVKINQKGSIVKTGYFDSVVDKICHKLNNKISITEKDIDDFCDSFYLVPEVIDAKIRLVRLKYFIKHQIKNKSISKDFGEDIINLLESSEEKLNYFWKRLEPAVKSESFSEFTKILMEIQKEDYGRNCN